MTFARPAGGDVDQAHADLHAARAHLAAVQQRVRQGLDGAAALATAEYAVHCALQRLDGHGWTPPSDPDDPEEA